MKISEEFGMHQPDYKPGNNVAYLPHDAGLHAICCLHHQNYCFSIENPSFLLLRPWNPLQTRLTQTLIKLCYLPVSRRKLQSQMHFGTAGSGSRTTQFLDCQTRIMYLKELQSSGLEQPD